MWTKITQKGQIKKLIANTYLVTNPDEELPAIPDRSHPAVYQVKELTEQLVILYQSSKNSFTLCSFSFGELLNGEWWVWDHPI